MWGWRGSAIVVDGTVLIGAQVQHEPLQLLDIDTVFGSGSCYVVNAATFVLGGVPSSVAGHLAQSLAYRVSVPVLLQLLYHFRRVLYTS